MKTQISIYIFLISSCLFYWSCQPTTSTEELNNDTSYTQTVEQEAVSQTTPTIEKIPPEESSPPETIEEFDRQDIQTRIQEKIEQNKALIVHAFVPLCDNEHQGIVPVNKSLGDGFNLQSNLYWGAKYGIKNHFKVLKDWKVYSTTERPTNSILERVTFRKKYKNGATVFLVVDAYQGDKMKECLIDFFRGITGRGKATIKHEETDMKLHMTPDLVIFNGHNGLMDMELPYMQSKDEVVRDVAVIACASNNYFRPYLLRSKGYPLLMTTNFMAPEGYVMEALLDGWATQKDGAAIRVDAGKAYHKYQKCGIKGATNLFDTGWGETE